MSEPGQELITRPGNGASAQVIEGAPIQIETHSWRPNIAGLWSQQRSRWEWVAPDVQGSREAGLPRLEWCLG